MSKNNYRWGDCALTQIDKLPDGLKQADTKTLMTGSNNNPHTFESGKFYPYKKDNFVFGCLVSKDTKLFHISHGDKKVGNLLEAGIEDGIYELRRQCEFTNDQIKPVID